MAVPRFTVVDFAFESVNRIKEDLKTMNVICLFFLDSERCKPQKN